SPSRSPEPGRGWYPGKVARILVVDDEEGVRSFLAEALSADGHTVTPLGDVAPALDALARGDHDLLLTDLRMPGGEGMEIVRRARQDRPDLPVIVLTAHGTVET